MSCISFIRPLIRKWYQPSLQENTNNHIYSCCWPHWPVQSQADLINCPRQSSMHKNVLPTTRTTNCTFIVNLCGIFLIDLKKSLSIQIYINFKEERFFDSNLRSQHYNALSKLIVCNEWLHECFYISISFQSKYHLFCY